MTKGALPKAMEPPGAPNTGVRAEFYFLSVDLSSAYKSTVEGQEPGEAPGQVCGREMAAVGGHKAPPRVFSHHLLWGINSLRHWKEDIKCVVPRPQ